MKKIKSFLEFTSYLKESEIVRMQNSHVGKKTCNILLISRTSRRCLVSMTADSKKWGGIQSFLDPESSTKAELSNETVRAVRELTGYQGNLEISPSYIYVTEDVSHHSFVGLIEKEFMPNKNDGVKMYSWLTLEEILELSPKEEALEEMLKNDKSFFKYLKKL